MHPCSFLKQESYSLLPDYPHYSLSAACSLVGQQTKLNILNFFHSFKNLGGEGKIICDGVFTDPGYYNDSVFYASTSRG